MRVLVTSILLFGLCSSAFAALTKPELCGSDVGCYSDCDGSSCDFVVTWKDNGGGGVDFTLSLPVSGNQAQYVALGLSSDTSMGGDSVTACVVENGGGAVYKSHNPDKYNQPLTDVPPFKPLPEKIDITTFVTTGWTKEGISNEVGSVTDGVLTCKYTQSKTSTNNKIFDLNSDWTLLVANGIHSNGALMQHGLSPLPSISASTVDFQSTDDVGSADIINTLVKVHGCLMMFAWVFCASIGIVLARHYKPMWPNSKLCKEKVWFASHRGIMVTAFLSCVAGFVVIFVDVGEWVDLTGSSGWQKAHPILGVVVTALVVLNPLMAVARPHPESEYRFIFNWAHWFVGIAAHLISMLTMIIGVTMAKAQTPFYVVWILVAFAAYQMCMELFLEIFDCCIAGKGKKYYRDGSMKDPRGSLLKKVMLCLHVIIITGFAVACIVIVATSTES